MYVDRHHNRTVGRRRGQISESEILVCSSSKRHHLVSSSSEDHRPVPTVARHCSRYNRRNSNKGRDQARPRKCLCPLCIKGNSKYLLNNSSSLPMARGGGFYRTIALGRNSSLLLAPSHHNLIRISSSRCSLRPFSSNLCRQNHSNISKTLRG